MGTKRTIPRVRANGPAPPPSPTEAAVTPVATRVPVPDAMARRINGLSQQAQITRAAVEHMAKAGYEEVVRLEALRDEAFGALILALGLPREKNHTLMRDEQRGLWFLQEMIPPTGEARVVPAKPKPVPAPV